VEGDHDGAVVVAGDAGALAYWCGVFGIDAGADYGDFLGAKKIADDVGVVHDDFCLCGGAISGDGPAIVAACAAVSHAVAWVDDYDGFHGRKWEGCELFGGLDDDGLFGGEGIFSVLAVDGDFGDATGEGGDEEERNDFHGLVKGVGGFVVGVEVVVFGFSRRCILGRI